MSTAPASRDALRPTLSPTPLYVGAAGARCFGIMHPAAGRGRGQAVLIIPPFGNADNGSYMPRRTWAQHLAAAGHPCLRIDLPATADSPGGPHDHNVLEAWVAGIVSATNWLKERDGRRVATIGLGLGGLISCLAAAAGAPIDDLVLWGTPGRGGRFLRELAVFEQMLEAHAGVDPETRRAQRELSALEDGAIESVGFLLSPDTVKAIRMVDLSQLELPPRPSRRALLLERDGMAVDTGLDDALRRNGVSVARDAGPGFSVMMAAPYESEAPRTTMATVDRWLDRAPRTDTGAWTVGEPTESADSVVMEVGDVRVRETPMPIAHRSGGTLGILTEPADGAIDRSLMLVLVNSGALRRMGPNRMWTELARRWAARGVAALRVDVSREDDLSAVMRGRWHAANARPGDIEWDHFERGFADQYTSALDAVAERTGTRRFLVVGLSSGGYWSLRQLLHDDRVRAAVLVNPGRLTWHEDERVRRDETKLRDRETWRRALRGDIPAQRILHSARAMLAARLRMEARRGLVGTEAGPAKQIVERLAAADQQLTFLFGPSEPLPKALRSSGELPMLESSSEVTVEWLPDAGLAHVLESVSLQHVAHALIDQAIDRARASAGRLA